MTFIRQDANYIDQPPAIHSIKPTIYNKKTTQNSKTHL